MKNLLDFATNSEVNVRNLKKFSALVFEREIPCYDLPAGIILKVRPLFYGVNGYVRTLKTSKQRKAVIVVNSRTVLHTPKKRTNVVTWFYVYATIVHELEHIRLIQELESNKKIDFKRFIAALYQYNRYSWMYADNIFRGLIPIPNYARLQNRMTSLPELICTLNGFNRAYDVFGDLLEVDEKKTVLMMIASLVFLSNHMEITYGISAQPYNQFAQNLIIIQKKVEKDITVLKRLKQLQNIFDSNGILLSPEKMYQDRNAENAEYYDSLLVRLFLVYDMNWGHLFLKNTEFFRYMEKLANEYCMRTVYYLKNIQIGEVFLNADVLQDNAAMLIRNTERLNVLMKKFGMKHTSGSVFALYK